MKVAYEIEATPLELEQVAVLIFKLLSGLTVTSMTGIPVPSKKEEKR